MPNATLLTDFRNLDEMFAYLEQQAESLTSLSTEVGEIQKEFETRFVQSQQQFENACLAVQAWVEAHDWRQPDWLIQELEKRLPETKALKQKRLQQARQELTELEKKRVEIEEQSRTAEDALKQANPGLNAREEQLKQQQDEAQKVVEAKDSEWRAASQGASWLLHPGRVRRARQAVNQALVTLYGVNGRLTEVRNTWATMQEQTTEKEEVLQEAWRLRIAEIARLRGEISQLESNLDLAAHEAALDDLLSAITEPRGGDEAEFDKLLSQVVNLHRLTNDYESGIARVAELIGIMRGLSEGLGRFSHSVASVRDEQNSQSELPRLKLQAPEFALQFHSLWPQLQPVVKDEQAAGDHPHEFADKLTAVIGDRLSDTNIDQMFNALAAELDRATKQQWG